MKITYIPEVIDGEQRQGDTITKYGVAFTKDQTIDVADEVKAKKMLSNPFFHECAETDGVEVIKAPRKKRGKNKN